MQPMGGIGTPGSAFPAEGEMKVFAYGRFKVISKKREYA